jgi:molybdopterin synthase catalytic subunit
MNEFRILASEFQPELEKHTLMSPTCGGFVTFEGLVRNRNDGLDVIRLEYQAYETLALKEGNRVISEAFQRFPIEHALCIHRVGKLEIGQLAVWVAVSASHRDEAFKACRYIIDEIKHRVPIWKKEYYVNGDSGWVNCEACAAHAHNHQHDQ